MFQPTGARSVLHAVDPANDGLSSNVTSRVHGGSGHGSLRCPCGRLPELACSSAQARWRGGWASAARFPLARDQRLPAFPPDHPDRAREEERSRPGSSVGPFAGRADARSAFPRSAGESLWGTVKGVMPKRRLVWIVCATFFLTVLLLSYANHFRNGFYFDDTHTIVHNRYVHDIRNIPLFFTDIAAFGTMPDNRGYRPMVATLNAIDYWIAGGLEPVYFHASIFFWYVVQLVLMFFVFKRIFDLAVRQPANEFLALFGVAFYAMHPMQAETINYIISRSDSFSTLCVVASLFLYQIRTARRIHLYLVPALIGIHTKEAAVMFAPLLFFYILLFEEKVALTQVPLVWRRPVVRSIVKAAPAFIVCFGVFLFDRWYFVPGVDALGSSAGRWQYFATQWTVLAHYLGNFLLPVGLSVDYDFALVPTVLDRAVLLSLGLLLGLGVLMIALSRRVEWRPVSYGLVWFFVSLAPTSSFVPFGQIANDHRMFFADIGLVLSATWTVGLLWRRIDAAARPRRIAKIALPTVAALVIVAYGYGTHQRNKVWHSAEALWFDALQKAPESGRIQMNYGLTQMEKGDYAVAERHFERAIQFLPRWAYTNINMGILQNALGRPERAERYFTNAIRFQPRNPEGYYYYARFLSRHGRDQEALELLRTGNELSPGYTKINGMLPGVRARAAVSQEERARALAQQIRLTTAADDLLDLSLQCYENSEFALSIEAAEKILESVPNSAQAYNNICAAQCALQEWEQAVVACTSALELQPDYALARANLRWATDGKSRMQ